MLVFAVLLVAVLLDALPRWEHHVLEEPLEKRRLTALLREELPIDAFVILAVLDCVLVTLGHLRMEEVNRGRNGSNRLDPIARLGTGCQLDGPRSAHAVAGHKELLLSRDLEL